jgi:hypothetical protein
VVLRAALAASSLVTLGHRDDVVAGAAMLATAGPVVYWMLRARNRLAVYREVGAPAA